MESNKTIAGLDVKRLKEASIKKYGNDDTANLEKLAIMIRIAHCARTSYLNHEGKDDYEADIKLYDFLKEQGHWSPFEHALRVPTEKEYYSLYKGKVDSYEVDPGGEWIELTVPKDDKGFGWCANMRGFITHRWEIENEA